MVIYVADVGLAKHKKFKFIEIIVADVANRKDVDRISVALEDIGAHLPGLRLGLFKKSNFINEKRKIR